VCAAVSLVVIAASFQKLKDAFYANPVSEKNTTSDAPAEKKVVQGAPKKPKLKLKNATVDDPFASDVDEDEAEEESRKRDLKSKKLPAKNGKLKSNQVEEDEEESRPRKKTKT
jgi:hypothetical protein